PTRPVPELAAQLGVGCVTCHVIAGQVLATNRHADVAEPNLAIKAPPHPVLRDARLDGTAACSSCHEFEFPDRTARRTPELMQSTVTEHAGSAQRDQACANCHMPRAQNGVS